MNKSPLLVVDSIFPSQWITLSLIAGVGAIRLKQLLQQFKTPTAILNATQQALVKIVPLAVACAIVNHNKNSALQKQLEKTKKWWCECDTHSIICPDSEFYPDQLKNLPDPPAVLYVIGDVTLLKEPQLSIVGTRKPTSQGQKITRYFAQQLSLNGFVITSGLALGIDSAAHQGALLGTGQTISVLGTGIDICYPKTNQALYHEIRNKGLIVSENPLGVAPHKANFPRRNRIISGLSIAVLVVEAAQKSGSLITARLAAEQGRDVFAIPHSILNPVSSGCHQLIREGATLVEKPNDIIFNLKQEIQQLLIKHSDSQEQYNKHTTKPIDKAQIKVLDAMGFDVITPDELALLCSINFTQLSILLTELELAGFIESVAGGYIRIN